MGSSQLPSKKKYLSFSKERKPEGERGGERPS